MPSTVLLNAAMNRHVRFTLLGAFYTPDYQSSIVPLALHMDDFANTVSTAQVTNAWCVLPPRHSVCLQIVMHKIIRKKCHFCYLLNKIKVPYFNSKVQHTGFFQTQKLEPSLCPSTKPRNRNGS